MARGDTETQLEIDKVTPKKIHFSTLFEYLQNYALVALPPKKKEIAVSEAFVVLQKKPLIK